MIEALIAIWAFCWIFNLLPLDPPIKMIVNVLGLVLIIIVMFAPMIHTNTRIGSLTQHSSYIG